MLNLLHTLLDQEARPLAQAAAHAVAAPTRKALWRLGLALGFMLAALVVLIGAIAIGTVALSALALDLLPQMQIVLGWSAGALLLMTVLFVLCAMGFARGLNPQRLVREGKDAFAEERAMYGAAAHKPANGSAADPVVTSYAFARGFADGLRQ
jgi:hypothetical protein